MPGRKWGGVARRGAGKVGPEDRRRQPPGRGRPPPKRQPRKEAPELGPPPAWEPEQWIEEPDEGAVRREASRAVARGATEEPRPARPRRKAPADVSSEI